MNRRVLSAMLGMIGLLASATTASAVIVIDGVKDADYGTPLAVQDTPTHFGDNLSELNAAYAKKDGSGNVALMLTGNLENGTGSANGLIIFVDSRAGGAVNPEIVLPDGYGQVGSFGGGRTEEWSTDLDGSAAIVAPPGGSSILDPTFNPDVALVINIFQGMYYTDVVDMTLPNDPATPDDRNIYIGSNDPLLPTEVGPAAATTGTYTRGDGSVAKGSGGTVEHAFDDTNTLGVNGWVDPGPGDLGDPLSATTGYEALLSSAFLANDGQPIRLMAFITNDNGSFLSNQFLGEAGGVHGLNNLGGPGFEGGTPLFDASTITGNQFFTVPAAAGPTGDYNNDGVWDARDYVIWRDTDGSQVGYDAWRSNFGTGAGAGGGIGSAAAVPEPASVLLALLGLVAAVGMARRK